MLLLSKQRAAVGIVTSVVLLHHQFRDNIDGIAKVAISIRKKFN